jgi:transposase
MVSCDPWHNKLISKGGDKSDALDWRKLAQLYRGGFVTPVHHPEELARSLFKQHVQLYHDRVRHRVSEALKVVWRARRFGVVVRERDLAEGERREALLGRLPDDATVREDVAVMLAGYDKACEQVVTLRRRLAKLAKGDPVVARLTELPGVGPVRAATFVAVVDTPFRFRTKQRLWPFDSAQGEYAGIGLERRQSGSGRPSLRVPERCNRTLPFDDAQGAC